MDIRLDLRKSLQENAAEYFEKAKKSKNKMQGAKTAIAQAQIQAQKQQERHEQVKQKIQLQQPKEHWYHKYHWSKTTNGHLMVAGQNASANEKLIKAHTEPSDIVFHTDMAGSPFTILKAGGEHTQQDLDEAAQLTAAYSKAWQNNLASLEVFYVKPEQVTKEAQSGEYLTKGSFMIRGETNYINATVQLCIGVITQEGYHPQIFAGTQESAKKHCSSYAQIRPGDNKTSDVAKQLQQRFSGDLDTYVKMLPAGGTTIAQIHNG